MTGPRGQRRITLPGSSRPPDNPPRGDLPTDFLLELTQAERADYLAGRDPYDAWAAEHDAEMARQVAAFRARRGATVDLDQLTPDTSTEASA
ncbi:MAG: hypothetical protein L0I76_24940 [Pseudonocardia sp.]|nr:hypothetical protein [Pseudonocardia sp.]